jgi:hypothetical protein
VVAVSGADLYLFGKVESIIYRQGLFFKENSVVTVSGANLCFFFWEVKSVIYRQRSFFEEISVVAIVKVDLCFF